MPALQEISAAFLFSVLLSALGCAPTSAYQGGGYYYGRGLAPGTTGAAYLPGAGVAPEYPTAAVAPSPAPLASTTPLASPRGRVHVLPPHTRTRLSASSSVAALEMSDAEALFVQIATPIPRLAEPMAGATRSRLHPLAGAQLSLHTH